MNILLLGSGGREHALAWKIRQSKHCKELFIAPGNTGTANFGTNIDISVTDFEVLKKFCLQNEVKMIVVGPEEPLVMGIYDYFNKNEALKNIQIIGPSATAAQLEGSKAFAKAFMHKYNIPTAAYFEFDRSSYETGRKYIELHSLPIVLKADGLAAGKGVIICNTVDEALQVFEEMIVHKQFGEASAKVVVEQFLQGVELSVFALTDGKEYKIIGHAKDYKRIGEGDIGPNTGGMGCVSPVPFVDKTFMKKVEEKIVKPTVQGLELEGFEYRGFLFFGLMNVNGEPYVIEYNCRMGDPETEVVIPLLNNDLIELCKALYEGNLGSYTIDINSKVCCTVMAVSGGYPGEYKKNIGIDGLEKGINSSSIIFHAGTKQEGEKVVTNGGRVFTVTSFGENIKQAVNNSLAVLEHIHFEGMYYRKDVGFEFI